MKTRILIFRHGQSVMNTEGVLSGHQATPLTDLGRRQAAALAKRLGAETIDYLYSSDLERARQTAEIVCEPLGLEVHTHTELRERSWGEFDYQPVAVFREALSKSTTPFFQYRPPGGESLEDMHNRVAPLLDTLLDTHRGRTIAISAHHSINKVMIQYLLQRPWEQWSTLTQNNCCLNSIRLNDERSAAVEFLNCSLHLDEVVE